MGETQGELHGTAKLQEVEGQLQVRHEEVERLSGDRVSPRQQEQLQVVQTPEKRRSWAAEASQQNERLNYI